MVLRGNDSKYIYFSSTDSKTRNFYSIQGVKKLTFAPGGNWLLLFLTIQIDEKVSKEFLASGTKGTLLHLLKICEF